MQFQIGLMLTITKWHKGQRDIVLSIPFVDVSITQIQIFFK